jgi:putative endonuclease
MKEYFVYILTNKSRTLYTGVTGDLEGRVYQHKHGQGSTFTSKYKIDQLVYYESFANILDAIAREKQIKGWLRAKKIALIESMNPNWEDLSADWYDEGDSSPRPVQPGTGLRSE